MLRRRIFQAKKREDVKWVFDKGTCMFRQTSLCVCVCVQRYKQRLPGVTVKRVLLFFLAVGRYQQASTLVEYSAFGSYQAGRGPVGLFSIVWVGEQKIKVCGGVSRGRV
jgi:hypothetical protein